MSGSNSDRHQGHATVECKQCSSKRMRRLPREGFLQKNIYSIFGYYPWECPICRLRQFFKARGKRARRQQEWSGDMKIDGRKSASSSFEADMPAGDHASRTLDA